MPRLPALAVVTLIAASMPAMAWQAQEDADQCVVTHAADGVSLRLTYDIARLEYAIAITLPDAWPDGAVFSMRFDGPASVFISTDRHVLSDSGSTLTVTDSGFGNVLNGLEFNDTATSVLGERAVVLELEGAAPAVQAFRACAQSVRV